MARIDDKKAEQYLRDHERTHPDQRVSPSRMAEKIGSNRTTVIMWLRRHHKDDVTTTTRQDNPGIQKAREARADRARRILPRFGGHTTDTAIAREEGMSRSTIERYRAESRVPGSTTRRLGDRIEAIRPYVGGSETVEEIAAKTKIPGATVARLLRRFGEKRGKGGPGRPRGRNK